MKTKKQIEHYLAKKNYKTKFDFEGIYFYCLNKFNIKLHKPSQYFPELTDENKALDYPTFTNWLSNGFGAGNVVEWENNIGLIQDGGTKEVRICLKIDRNGPSFNFYIISGQSIHQASETSIQRIYTALLDNHKEFNAPFFQITDKFIPSSGNIVTFKNHKTGISGVGVVKCIKKIINSSENNSESVVKENAKNDSCNNSKDKSGSVYMYCYYIKGEPVRYSMDEYLGMVDDFQFTQISPSDYPRKLLESALEGVGKSWNQVMRRIEPVNMKVPKGSKYFYISDKRTVVCTIEKETATSHKRYLVGNYFKDMKDAEEILEMENNLRKKFLARPEKSFEKDEKQNKE